MPYATSTAFTSVPSSLPVMLDTAQASALLNVCQKHIRDLCAEGGIYAVKVGNTWRIPRDRFLAQFGLVDAE